MKQEFIVETCVAELCGYDRSFTEEHVPERFSGAIVGKPSPFYLGDYMPGWGTGTLENEDAQVWLKGLGTVSVNDLRAVLAKAASDPNYLEEFDSSVGLAAAEVVAALKGAPAEVIPAPVKVWVEGTDAGASAELAPLALSAVRRIVSNSELKDRWQEADGLPDWQAAVHELEHRLES